MVLCLQDYGHGRTGGAPSRSEGGDVTICNNALLLVVSSLQPRPGSAHKPIHNCASRFQFNGLTARTQLVLVANLEHRQKVPLKNQPGVSV